MRLIVIDLVPALLSWEGRDRPAVPDDAATVLDDLFSRYRLVGVADADRSGSDLRRALEDHDIAGYFESVGTAAGFGPAVSPRVLRRLIAGIRVPIGETAVVTGRALLARQLQRARFAVVLTEGPEGFVAVPDALEAIEAGRVTP